MDCIQRLRGGVLTHSPEEMQLIAMQLAMCLEKEAVLCLHGNLGAGKTTFVGGLAAAWGITVPITSPTYTLLNVHEGKRRLLHCDAYRLKNPEEIEALGLEDFMIAPYCWVIEWPERIENYIPEDALHLYFESHPDGRRSVHLKP